MTDEEYKNSPARIAVQRLFDFLLDLLKEANKGGDYNKRIEEKYKSGKYK